MIRNEYGGRQAEWERLMEWFEGLRFGLFQNGSAITSNWRKWKRRYERSDDDDGDDYDKLKFSWRDWIKP